VSVGRKITAGALGGAIYTFTNVLFSLVQLRLVVRHLPPVSAGLWILFLTLGSYVAFFDLGISPTLSREVSFLIGSSKDTDHHALANLIATCRRIFQWLALAVFVLASVLGGLVMHQTSSDVAGATLAWMIFCTGASINILGGASFAILNGYGFVATEKLVRSASLVAGLIAMMIVLHLGYGLVALAIIWTAQGFLARALGWAWLYRNEPSLRQTSGRFQKDLLWKVATPSAKYAAVQFGAILILQASNPLIAAILGASYVPPFEALNKMAAAVMILGTLIANSSTPFISMAHAAGDDAVVRAHLLRNLRIVMAFIAVAVSFLAVFGDRIVGVWLGPSLFAGNKVLWTLLLMIFLETHHVVFASAVMATGRIFFVRAALLAGIINIVLAIYMTRHWGLWGTALAILIAQITTNNWYAPFIAIRVLHIRLADLAKHVWIPLAFGLVVCFGIDVLLRISTNPGFKGLILSFLICGSFCTLMMSFLLLSADERGAIVRMFVRGQVRPEAARV
jgi:O-antigen/teichoic acid export membrane protein